MRALQPFLIRAFCFGLLLLIVPLCDYQGESGPHGKIAALHTMLESLMGLALVSCMLWGWLIIRRREKLEEERLSRNAEILNRLIEKKNLSR
jgi:hypothetical protein